MKTLTAAVSVLFCLSSPAWAQVDAKKPPLDAKKPPPKDAKPVLKFQERYGYQADVKTYSQKTPKDTLESIIKAVINQRMDYLMAHLADPAYVDGKVASYARAGERVDLSATTLFSDRLGANVSTPDADLIRKFKLKDRVGIIIEGIRDGSPAANAGLQNGDLLIFLGEAPKELRTVANPPADFLDRLKYMQAGRKHQGELVRNGKVEPFKNLILPDVETLKRLDAFRKVVQETTNLYFEDAARIQELRQFAQGAEWKIDEDPTAGTMKATGTHKQLGNRHVYLVLREDRWFLENRQTKKEK
jgi:hypothetical protein